MNGRLGAGTDEARPGITRRARGTSADTSYAIAIRLGAIADEHGGGRDVLHAEDLAGAGEVGRPVLIGGVWERGPVDVEGNAHGVLVGRVPIQQGLQLVLVRQVPVRHSTPAQLVAVSVCFGFGF